MGQKTPTQSPPSSFSPPPPPPSLQQEFCPQKSRKLRFSSPWDATRQCLLGKGRLFCVPRGRRCEPNGFLKKRLDRVIRGKISRPASVMKWSWPSPRRAQPCSTPVDGGGGRVGRRRGQNGAANRAQQREMDGPCHCRHNDDVAAQVRAGYGEITPFLLRISLPRTQPAMDGCGRKARQYSSIPELTTLARSRPSRSRY